MTIGIKTAYYEYFHNIDDSDSIAMNVDGSGASVHFDIEHNGTQRPTVIGKITLAILDNGTLAPTNFGARATLTNGLLVRMVDLGGKVLFDVTKAAPIKKNSDWALLSGVDSVVLGGAGDDLFVVRWDFPTGVLIRPRERLRITVRDDLTDLTEYRMMAEGRG